MPISEARQNPPVTAAARSSRLILGTQALRLVVRIGGTVMLARLLTPTDYGVFGMAATVHGLAYVFQDFGLSTVTIRKPELSETERNNLFWLNVVLGAALALVVGLSGIAAASFFHEPALRLILPVLAVTFIFNGLHTQMRAQLVREHRFSDLNKIEIGAFTSSTALAIVVAWAGGGAWAPVTLAVVAEIAMAIGVWLKQPWRPGRPHMGLNSLSLLPSGIGLTGNDFCRYTQRNGDSLLVGKWLGAGPLGIYGRAVQIASLPVVYLADPLMLLTISTLRQLANSRDEARAFWKRMLTDLSWVMMPLSVFFACIPFELTTVLLGSHWSQASAVLRGFSIGVAALPLQLACSWLFIAAGPSRRLLLSSSINAAAVCAAAIVTRNLGIDTIANSVGFANLAGALVSVALLKKQDIASARDAAAAIARPLGASAILAVALMLALPRTGEMPATRLVVSVAIAGAWISAIWLLWRGARLELKQHFMWKGR